MNKLQPPFSYFTLYSDSIFEWTRFSKQKESDNHIYGVFWTPRTEHMLEESVTLIFVCFTLFFKKRYLTCINFNITYDEEGTYFVMQGLSTKTQV